MTVIRCADGLETNTITTTKEVIRCVGGFTN